mmetsp:Transcript_17344/g.42855  ORF Transcript_17344/g.42855 Transcript_17344/m.42855 type:complete len:200 (-) Transcript_17344:2098-2697(-)
MYQLGHGKLVGAHRELHRHVTRRVDAEAHADEHRDVTHEDAREERGVRPGVGGHRLGALARLHAQDVHHRLHRVLQALPGAQAIVVHSFALHRKCVPHLAEVGHRSGVDEVEHGHVHVLQSILVRIAVVLGLAAARIHLLGRELKHARKLRRRSSTLVAHERHIRGPGLSERHATQRDGGELLEETIPLDGLHHHRHVL